MTEANKASGLNTQAYDTYLGPSNLRLKNIHDHISCHKKVHFVVYLWRVRKITDKNRKVRPSVR
jgi:hypothetical protein